MIKVNPLLDIEKTSALYYPGTIHDRDVHLWFCPLKTDKSTDLIRSVLAADEIAKAQRLIIREKRHQLICSRYFLRTVLASYLNCSPEMVAFRYSEFGKPYLAGGDGVQLSFNLSHSDDLVVLAISSVGEIGVDVEKIDRNFDWQGVAQRYLSPEENHLLLSVSPTRRQRRFYRIWTAKEASLKCTGAGLGCKVSDPHWQRQIYIAPGYVCTCACDIRPSGIVRYRLKDL